MGQINLKLPDDLDRKFREVAVKKFGPWRGFVQKAIKEALEAWVDKNG